ncbi:Sugar phosphate isomerase/epimerase [Paenibacillus sp. 1_12]|uniref:sugar phosphate isomerase/epimerase family protein n=1 Tax=Paenibacillus sp. 1_12 TaxID=1566278 RepID=UPI0008F0EBF3|nr:TIM barrel protein [Paenibacillus sp. 1_12]SFK96565.1 Sugar phosphate isomerase/epimerase [Paenibacillus sp. 1_12]
MKNKSMIRLGGNGVPLHSEDPREMAIAHRQFGYRAAYCPQISLTDTHRIKAIREGFAAEDVIIAEVGAWCNLITSEEATRSKNLDFVCEKLALADEIGALCCVDYIGSVAPGTDYGPHPNNLTEEAFELAVETARLIVDRVKPKRAKFCLEMMQWTLPDSPEILLDMIKAIDRPTFAAHLDPVNIIVSPRQYYNNGELIKRCFELLGPYIVSCHAKDIILQDRLSLHLDEIRLGLGQLDYKVYLTELSKLAGDVPIMLEHLQTSEEYIRARDEIVKIGSELGIAFNGRDA